MRYTTSVALAAALACGQAGAQTYVPDRASPPAQDYGDPVGRAAEAVPAAAVGPGAVPDPDPVPVSAPRPAKVPAKAPATPTDRDDGGDGREFLHSASEYAGEPHRVALVDRLRFDPAFLPADLPNSIGLQAGSVLIDVAARQLYFAKPDGTLRRYGVAVGRAGKAWHGMATVGRMGRWPDWRPTANIRREDRRLKAVVRGGSSNPLGARAIYLYQGSRDTMYRIHGTNAPYSIGRFASHGCIRMVNEDVIELYSMIRPGATVVVR